MSAETIHDLLKRRPFEPFEVRMSDDDAFSVRHREFAFVLKSNMVIGDPESVGVAICSLLHFAETFRL